MAKHIIGWPTWTGVVAKDFQAQRRFYRDTLGIPELRSGDGWVQFDLTPPHVFEVIAESSKPEYQNKSFQIGFAVSNIQEARDELIERGVKPISEIQGGSQSGVYWCYFEDAEGNVFAILQRLDPSQPTT